MSDPLAFVPFAAAAGGGHVHGVPTAAAVSAGVTLLQRSAPLVRQLAGRRSAILLPPGPELVVALAASDGRGAVLLDPRGQAQPIARILAQGNVGAVFTTTALAHRLPDDVVTVLLDDALRSATVRAAGKRQGTRVDLGSHHGLSLEGQRDIEGAEEEVLCVVANGLQARSHRTVLQQARRLTAAMSLTPLDVVVTALPHAHVVTHTAIALAALLKGAHWRSALPPAHPDATVLVGTAPVFAWMLRAEARGAHPLTRLRSAWCGGTLPESNLVRRFEAETGVVLQPIRED